MAPLAVPRLPPGRLYFLFQQPIHTSPDDLQVCCAACAWALVGVVQAPCGGCACLLGVGAPAVSIPACPHPTRSSRPPLPAHPPLTCLPALQDRERCDELYRATRQSVEDGLAWLQRQRQRDPYKDFLPRQLYEAAYRGRQAPTFPLN